MEKKIDFTNCKRIIGRAYNGANGKKIAVEYEGERYMLKFPPSGNKKPTELSYTNSSISEHIASSIYNMVGVKAQVTELGTFSVNGKEKIVCACKDFTDKNKNLYDFCSIKNTVIDSEHNGTGTELSDVLETIEKQQFVNPKELLEHFWDVFVVDALLGNFDRHNGNWGFLFDDETVLKNYVVTSQSITPNTELTMTYTLDKDGNEYDNLIESQNIEEVELYVTRKNNYTNDVVETTEPITEDSETPDATEVENQDRDDDVLVDGMRPEFKEAMDAYEAFYNEYCAFLEKYNENPTDMTLIVKYGELLIKAAEMDEAFNTGTDEDLNNDEFKYYLEVNTRVMQKLLDVTG